MAKIPLSVIKEYQKHCVFGYPLAQCHVVTVSQDYDVVYVLNAKMVAKSVSELKVYVKQNFLRAPENMKEEVYIVSVGSLKECQEVKEDLKNILKEVRKDIDLQRENAMITPSTSATGRRKTTIENAMVSQSILAKPKEREVLDNTDMTLHEITSKIKALIQCVHGLTQKISCLADEVKNFKGILQDSKSSDNGDFSCSNLKIIDSAASIIKTKRNSDKWRRGIKFHDFDGLSDEESKKVKREPIHGSPIPTKLMIALGMIVFGEKLLCKKLLGENGALSRKSRCSDRQRVIPIEKEVILREILHELDGIFIENWQTLVRGPINQKGRELKAKLAKLGQTSSDHDDDSQDCSSNNSVNEFEKSTKRPKTSHPSTSKTDSQDDSSNIMPLSQHDNSEKEVLSLPTAENENNVSQDSIDIE